VIALLAKKLGLPKSAITLESGETARMKILLVSGEAASVIGRLETLVSP